jgi:hypothetical protein
MIVAGAVPRPRTFAVIDLNVADRRFAAVADRDRERREWAGKRALPSDTKLIGAVSTRCGPLTLRSRRRLARTKQTFRLRNELG